MADTPSTADPAKAAGVTHYTVLARRYRPQTFSEVIGQGHVARALTNAIAGGRVAHAYLFTGARGVGKTSTARIFAKALNCPNAPAGGPDAGVPCNRCDICEAVSAGDDVDVLEIDGASNNGVDHVRDLRGNVTVKPMRARYKVYIIDEVHMLSKAAFNALLKTLEEPPGGVKFIFCTTEPNKLPDTILSRVQRFDFATVHTQNIIQRLAAIAEAEGFVVEQPALELVARRAAGSMRDSQSLFDQLLSFGGTHDEATGKTTITAGEVHRLFGTAPDARLVELVGRCVTGDPAGALSELEGAIGDGVQLDELADQLVGYLRDVMVLAAGADGVPLTGVAEDHRADLAGQAESWGVQTTLAAVQLLSEAKLRMGRVTFGRALLEAALVRAALLGDLTDLADLAASLKAGDGGGASARPNRPARPPRPPRPQTAPGRNGSPSRPATESRNGAVNRLEASPAPPPLAPKPEPAPAPVAETRPDPAPTPESAPQTEPDQSAAPVIPAEPARAGELLSALKELAGGDVPMAVRDATGCEVTAAAGGGPASLVLHFPAGFQMAIDRLEGKRPAVEKALSALTGGPTTFTATLNEPKTGDDAPAAAAPARRTPTRAEPLDPEDIPDDFVRRAAEVFEARQVTAKPLPPAETAAAG